jgi:hypothetical protein
LGYLDGRNEVPNSHCSSAGVRNLKDRERWGNINRVVLHPDAPYWLAACGRGPRSGCLSTPRHSWRVVLRYRSDRLNFNDEV